MPVNRRHNLCGDGWCVKNGGKEKEMVEEAGWWLSRLGPINIGLHEANETHHKRTIGCQIGKDTNMFGPPDHLDDGRKVDHRRPFGRISDPTPLLVDSIDQERAIGYTDHTGYKFQNFHEVSVLHSCFPQVKNQVVLLNQLSILHRWRCIVHRFTLRRLFVNGPRMGMLRADFDLLRNRAGGRLNSRLKARLKDGSDS